MKRKVLITITLLIFISIYVLVTIQGKKTKYINKDGALLAINVDNASQDNIPSVGNYTVDVNCINAMGSWDYDNWNLNLKNASGNVKCLLNFTSYNPANRYLNNQIISLSSNTSSRKPGGYVVHEVDNGTDTGYRYEGKNPDNYVLFNGEKWRIIGTFNGSAMGGTSNTYYTKLIRSEAIGGLTYESTNKTKTIWYYNNSSNDGTKDVSLGRLLNHYYKGVDYGSGTNCSSYSTTIKGTCKYSRDGITNVAERNMIFAAKWRGKLYATASTPKTLYGYDKDFSADTSANNTAYVGLMSVSDYGYGVLATSCARNTNLSAYNTAACGGSNWLKLGLSEWTITVATDANAWRVNDDGAIAQNNSKNGLSVRPAVYLKPEVYIKGGNGSYWNPYVLGM